MFFSKLQLYFIDDNKGKKKEDTKKQHILQRVFNNRELINQHKNNIFVILRQNSKLLKKKLSQDLNILERISSMCYPIFCLCTIDCNWTMQSNKLGVK